MKVSPEALLIQSTTCSKIAADQHSQGQVLLSSIQNLLSNDWLDSQAATQFHVLSEQWRQASLSVTDSLTGIATLLGKAANAFTDLDQQLATAIKPM